MIRRRGIGKGRLEVTTKERAEKRRLKRRRRMILIFICILFLIAGIIGIFHIPALRIKSVKVAGVETIPENALESLIKDNLAGSYFFLIPKDSIFFYPKRSIEGTVTDTYPEIKDVGVSLSNLTTLSSSVSERHQIGVWCKEEITCYFLDDTGYLFENAPQISGNVYFTYRGDLVSGTSTDALKGSFLDEATFKKLNTFIQALKDLHVFTPIAFTKTAQGEGVISTEEGVDIRINTVSDISATLENLTSALGSSSLQDPKTRASLEYIDLRFSNKIYYKLKGGSAVKEE